MKFILFDQSLKGLSGHYYEYDAAVCAAAVAKGHEVLLFAHATCRSDISIPSTDVRAWFSTDWNSQASSAAVGIKKILYRLPAPLRDSLAKAARSMRAVSGKYLRSRALRGPTPAAMRYCEECAGALREARCSDGDVVFVPTITADELFGLMTLIDSKSVAARLTYHVVLRRDAAEMDRPAGMQPAISALFDLIGNAPPLRDAIRFYCDTAQLCEDFKKIAPSAVSFELLPIPYPEFRPDAEALGRWSRHASPRLAYLGGARTEKGFHLLPAAEKSVADAGFSATWLLQAPVNTDLEEPDVAHARRALLGLNTASVQIIDAELSSSEFQSLLEAADIILLPYQPQAYRSRSSGILVQALAAGKVVVVPSGTWLSSETAGKGAVEFGAASDFAHAVVRAVERLSDLKQEAKSRARSYSTYHKASTLVEILLPGGSM